MEKDIKVFSVDSAEHDADIAVTLTYLNITEMNRLRVNVLI